MNNNEFSNSLQNILRGAKKKALNAGDNYVDLCHIFHAMISLQNSNVYKILVNLIFFLNASPTSKILFGIFSLSFFSICLTFKLNI